jgi:hypothetical protein
MPGKPKPMLNRPRGKVSDLRKKFNPRTGEETNKPGGKDPRTIYKPEAQIPPERQMRTGGRLRIGTYQNPTSERSKESIDNYVRGMRKNRSFQYKKNDRGKIIKIELKTGGLSPKQKAIASKAPPPDKIDGKDFAVLKAEKAKGRGMGLQDESIKPGKVIKAKTGKMTPIKKDPTTPVNPFEKRRKQLGGGKLKALTRVMGSRAALLGLAGAAAATGLNMAGKKLKEFADKKKDKKMSGGMMKKYSKGGGADTGRMGEMKSKISVAMDRASRRSRDKDRLTTRDKEEAINIIRRRSRNEDRITNSGDRLTNRDIESASSTIKGYKSGGKTKKLKDDYFKVLGVFPTIKKKMGGGMMQRPMGYKKGTMVKARGCKLGRSKPTKMY